MKARGPYSRPLNIYITVEADQALTDMVRKAEDGHGYRRVKQAVVDAIIKHTSGDPEIIEKILPHLPSRSQGSR